MVPCTTTKKIQKILIDNSPDSQVYEANWDSGLHNPHEWNLYSPHQAMGQYSGVSWDDYNVPYHFSEMPSELYIEDPLLTLQ